MVKMKRILLSLTALIMLVGCGTPKEDSAAESVNIAPQAVTTGTIEHDTVESGSSMWAGGRLGSMGQTKMNIDDYGAEELLLLDPGPSDGEFRLMITAAFDDGSYDVKFQTVYESPVCKVDFVERDGKTMLEYRRYQIEKDPQNSHYEDPSFFDAPHYFDIELRGEDIILTEDGAPFSTVAAAPVITQ